MGVSSSGKREAVRIAGLGFAWAGLAGSLVFWVNFVLFLANQPNLTGRTIDGAGHASLLVAGFINAVLIALFGLQHSLMARESVKAYIRRFVPEGLLRATYVHAANVAAFAILLFWQPIPITVWEIETGAWLIWFLFGVGWFILLTSALSFGILELHGIPQAVAWTGGQPSPPSQVKSGGWYGWLRHPMYAGLALGLWAAPAMSFGHLLLASGFSAYLLIGLHYEERDLIRRFGRAYASR